MNNVLCVSGGLDSFGLYTYLKKHEACFAEGSNDFLVHINTNVPYAKKELEIIKKLYPDVEVIHIKGWPVGIDADNYTVPLRNVVIANLAASYLDEKGGTIYMAGISNENHKYMLDKNSDFFEVLSDTMTLGSGKKITVRSNFFEIEWDKVEILQFLIEEGLLNEINTTTSCYDESSKKCGNCLVCFKRALAESYVQNLLNKTIEFSKFDRDPFTSTVGVALSKFFLSQYKESFENKNFDHYHRKRIFRDMYTLGVEFNKRAVNENLS